METRDAKASGKALIALFATLVSLFGVLIITGLLWWFLLRPIGNRASGAIERADESYAVREAREHISDEERAKAEEELKLLAGETREHDPSQET
ncbi:MAG: hypothetical protein JSS66_12705 [Armatimonadetes bacterium]|nr:hypothetical protein [Armatimonadota bacterium]